MQKFKADYWVKPTPERLEWIADLYERYGAQLDDYNGQEPGTARYVDAAYSVQERAFIRMCFPHRCGPDWT